MSESAAWVSLSAIPTGAMDWSSRSKAGASAIASACVCAASAGINTGAGTWTPRCCCAVSGTGAGVSSCMAVSSCWDSAAHSSDKSTSCTTDSTGMGMAMGSTGGGCGGAVAALRRRCRNRFVEFRLNDGNSKFRRSGGRGRRGLWRVHPQGRSQRRAESGGGVRQIAPCPGGRSARWQFPQEPRRVPRCGASLPAPTERSSRRSRIGVWRGARSRTASSRSIAFCVKP